MSAGKKKKLTYNELANYVVNLEKNVQNAVNTLGQTITDYVTYKEDYDKFMAYLKGKYQKENTDERNKKNQENTKPTEEGK